MREPDIYDAVLEYRKLMDEKKRKAMNAVVHGDIEDIEVEHLVIVINHLLTRVQLLEAKLRGDYTGPIYNEPLDVPEHTRGNRD